ncbi:hypothetical protein VL20_5189 [Microcystis panniformis FACHB-1757]|uniref:Uncharacterized protein n=1 Tax=Microcystis panniformis FACHB-1757 TaxID=1638788 RepID=A0A0K1S7D1_9CHRO|nr:hypothetical protein VL20_5189 [Microcystis panniformis FACHB-1757]
MIHESTLPRSGDPHSPVYFLNRIARGHSVILTSPPDS